MNCDVFISYACEDKVEAGVLADFLRANHLTVWFDDELRSGELFEPAIRGAIDASRCVIVLWSSESVDSPWVKAEVDRAFNQRKVLHALLEEVEPPLPYGVFQSEDLRGLGRGSSRSCLERLLGAVRGKLVEFSGAPAEVESLAQSGRFKVTQTYLDLLRRRNSEGDTSVLAARPYEWQGWSIDRNEHGDDFDEAARERMVKGSECLLYSPFLEKYCDAMGENILEVGPFFNPLIVPERFPGKKIFFWENDPNVLRWLCKHHGASCYPIFCDLDDFRGERVTKLYAATRGQFRRSVGWGGPDLGPQFSSVVASHLLNYIDYHSLLFILKTFLQRGALVFINNVVDYGLPRYFSEGRPRSSAETVGILKELGFVILEQVTEPVETSYGHERLLVVARHAC